MMRWLNRFFVLVITAYLLTGAAFYGDPQNTASGSRDTQTAVTLSAPQDTINWFAKDPQKDGVEGMRLEKAYAELPLTFTSPKVLVAVIDNGLDINHEELKDRVWTNTDEIAGDGIDNDKNGYIDDIHGWNYKGGKDGNSVVGETLELTREYVRYQKMKKENKQFTPEEKTYYEAVEKDFTKQRTTPLLIVNTIGDLLKKIEAAQNILKTEYGITDFSKEALTAFQAPDQKSYEARQTMRLLRDFLLSEKALPMYEYYKAQTDYNLNPDLKDRENIVKDNPDDFNDNKYGNNDVLSQAGGHGTFCTGIIMANRTNDAGIRGITDHVIVMPLAVVPDGDERDKDIALAIRYAVDNGAQIISMSFGKAYSPNKEWVDEAFKYAEDHGVLLVHASGNDGDNSDETPNYPNQVSKEGHKLTNFINVGANTQFGDKRLPANYSNYGKKLVDVFAPGSGIHSSSPNNEYQTANGTSAACPMVAGLAALMLSQNPDLTPQEIVEIIMSTVRKYDGLVVDFPGGNGTGLFEELSVSGGVVDAYNALFEVLKRQGKLK